MKKHYHLSKGVWSFWMVTEVACLVYICTMIYVLSGWYSVMHNNSSIVSESQDLLDYSLCEFNFDEGVVEYEDTTYELTEVYAFISAPCVARAGSDVYLVVQPDFNYMLQESGNKLGYVGFLVIVLGSMVASVLSLSYVLNKDMSKLKKVVTLGLIILLFSMSALILYIVFTFFN